MTAGCVRIQVLNLFTKPIILVEMKTAETSTHYNITQYQYTACLLKSNSEKI